MSEAFTMRIAKEYQERADRLPYNGLQDVGERRKLRIELQERCGLTELEALNTLNGFHVRDYIVISQRRREEEERRQEEMRERMNAEWKGLN